MVPHMKFLFTLWYPKEARKTGQSVTLVKVSLAKVSLAKVSPAKESLAKMSLAKVSLAKGSLWPKCDSAGKLYQIRGGGKVHLLVVI